MLKKAQESFRRRTLSPTVFGLLGFKKAYDKQLSGTPPACELSFAPVTDQESLRP
jgi:hypothetical protein